MELCTEIHSPNAIDNEPAKSPAKPASSTSFCPLLAPATPIINEKLEIKPSFPPKTAALSAFPPTERCLFSKRESAFPPILGLF